MAAEAEAQAIIQEAIPEEDLQAINDLLANALLQDHREALAQVIQGNAEDAATITGRELGELAEHIVEDMFQGDAYAAVNASLETAFELLKLLLEVTMSYSSCY